MQKTETAQRDFDVVVVGGGSAGIGVTASLRGAPACASR